MNDQSSRHMRVMTVVMLFAFLTLALVLAFCAGLVAGVTAQSRYECEVGNAQVP